MMYLVSQIIRTWQIWIGGPKGVYRSLQGGKNGKYGKIEKCIKQLEKKDLNLIPVRECTEKKSAQLLFFLEKMFLKRFLDLVSDTSDDAK